MNDFQKDIDALIRKRNSSSSKEIVEDKQEGDAPKQKIAVEQQTTIIKSEVKPLSISSNILTKHRAELSKKEIFLHLKNARISHKKWMSFVQILIRLADVETAKTSIPINYTMCAFGKWYYGDGQILAIFDEYLQIEDIHKNVHDTYLQIYNLYDKKVVGSFFNSEKKQVIARTKKVQSLSTILDEYSKVMFNLLTLVEKSVLNLTDDEILQLKH